MSVDKQIVNVTKEDNLGDFDFQLQDSLFNNIFISSNTPKGSRVDDPNFGSKIFTLLSSGKVTQNTLDLAVEYNEECVQWMIKINKIKSVTVTASINKKNTSQVDCIWDVVRADGTSVKFKTWFNVV